MWLGWLVIVIEHQFHCISYQIKEHYGPNLDKLQVDQTVGILVDDDHCLHLYVNGIDQGVAARDVPMPCYGFVDVYGQCEKVKNIEVDIS